MTPHDKELLLRTFARVAFGSLLCLMVILNFGTVHPVITWVACVGFATAWMFVTDDGREGK